MESRDTRHGDQKRGEETNEDGNFPSSLIPLKIGAKHQHKKCEAQKGSKGLLSSFFLPQIKHSFVIGLFNRVFRDFTSTVRTSPFLSGKTSKMRPSDHRERGKVSSTKRTRSSF